MTDLTATFDPPDAVKRTLHEGLRIIARLDQEQFESLLAWSLKLRPGALAGDNSSIVSETGIPNEYAGAVRLALGMMVETLSDTRITVEDFLDAGLDNSAFTRGDSPGVRRFAELIVGARAKFQEQSKIAQLQNAVLPSLTTFEMVVDSRIEFSGRRVVRSLPVVLAYADTDSEGQVIWFQMDEGMVLDLRDKLSLMLDQIKILKDTYSNAQ